MVRLDTATAKTSALDVARIRADFPILQRQVNGRPLIYLDNAATTQKPRQVIDYKAELAATARQQDQELTQNRPS